MNSHSTSQARTVLAIDPGYDRVGWAIGTIKSRREYELLSLGCIQTRKKDSITDRYTHIITDLSQLYTQHLPTELAIETLFFSKNVSTAIRVAEAKGVIMGFCVERKLKVTEYTPQAIKLAATGNGRADKKSVEKMTRLQLKLTTQKVVDDAVDAAALFLTHAVTG